ncbi:DUF1289 domain-containing protein [Segnochrobactrum spirostomi]|uniref:DUF1289 domain-containing protein n=1 Tax=Segnochrobactrum spirostomi TaxID=2608987 RepID=A0A6A7XXA7_9HYPH|nr:DUF1289 domain-containing protein [Segnochrobactrum spirostomi]MQT11214.1 DUF1289 domain-containing protein [Segnochrobactrum spirostomi]
MDLADDLAIPSSPCRRLCRLDEGRGVCVGCGRTLAEIAAWARLSERERRTIMAGLAARLAGPSDRAADAPPPPSREHAA